MPALADDLAAWDELELALEELEAHGELEAYLVDRPPANRAVLERLQAERGCGWRGHPAAMAAHLTDDIKQWRYVRLLSRKFREAADGVSKRQIWNLPARYGKSTIASQWGPAWLLDRNPRARIILTSYGDSLALENARAIRDIATAYPELVRFRLRRDARRADRFLTREGGGVLAKGIRSGITGFGAGRGGGVIVDDPFKNWEEAHSPTIRQAVFDAYRSVLRLRLDDDSAFVIIVHTRWHEHDLTGLLLAEDGQEWDLVRLPALAEAHDPNALDPLLRLPDPLGRAPGEVLEPERFALLEVKSRAADLGAYLAAGLEQQRPAPEEGGELKRAWWKWTTELPAAFDGACTSWDMKLKEEDSGDYIVGQAWGRTGADYWLREQLRGRWNLPTVRAAIALLSVRHPDISRHYIENTGNGPEVIRELRRGAGPKYVLGADIAGALGMTEAERVKVQGLLRRGIPGLLPVNPKGAKVARVRAISGRVEAGNVHLLEGNTGAAVLVNEAAAFPNAEHDDAVDAMTQALLKLGGTPAGQSSRATRRRVAVPSPARQAAQPTAPATTMTRRTRRRGRTIRGI